MKKITLVEQLNKMNRMMGIKKILSEGKWFNMATGFLEELIGKAQRVGNEIVINGKRMSKKTFDDLSAAIENPELFKLLEVAQKKLLGQILSAESSIVDDIYRSWIGATINAGKSKGSDITEEKIIKSILSDLDTNPGKTTYESILELTDDGTGNTDPFLAGVMTNKINKKMIDIDSGKFVPENGILDVSGKGPGLDKIKVEGQGAVQLADQILKGMNMSDLQTLARVYRRTFKPMYELQQEYLALLKSVEQKLSTNGGMAQDIGYEIKKMADIMRAGKKWYNDHPEAHFEAWLQESGVSQSVKNAIKGIGQTDPNAYRIAYNELKKDANYWNAFVIEARAFRRLWPFGDKTLGFGESLKRWGMFIIAKDPRLPSDIVQSLVSRGVKGELAMQIANRVLLANVVYPAIIGGLLIPLQILLKFAEFGYEMSYDEEVNWVDWNLEGKTSDDWPNIIWERFKSNFLGASPGTWYGELIDPTLLDEVWLDVIKPMIPAFQDVDKEAVRKKLEEWKNMKIEEVKNSEEYKKLNSQTKKYVDDLLETAKKAADDAVLKAVEPLVEKNPCITDSQNNDAFVIEKTKDVSGKFKVIKTGQYVVLHTDGIIYYEDKNNPGKPNLFRKFCNTESPELILNNSLNVGEVKNIASCYWTGVDIPNQDGTSIRIIVDQSKGNEGIEITDNNKFVVYLKALDSSGNIIMEDKFGVSYSEGDKKWKFDNGKGNFECTK